MAEIIGVRFKKVGKVYYFDPCGISVAVGQNVIVETARGVEFGEVALPNREIGENEVVKPLKKLLRVATPSDLKVVEANQKRADDAFVICEQKIAAHHLDMKLVAVEYTFDLNKVLFYFTADGRVDFRELVKDLASVFRTRIELRQIGVRDEAKVLGGLGICGRPLCCSSFLDDFQPVSINMAKQQNLSLNPTKISGTCGRLMCCLQYEHQVYEELSKVTPRPDSVVMTPDGEGIVLDSSLLRGLCSVRLDNDPDTAHVYRCADCQILHAARRSRKAQQGNNLPIAKPPLRLEEETIPEPVLRSGEPLSVPKVEQAEEKPAEKAEGEGSHRRRSSRRRRAQEGAPDKQQQAGGSKPNHRGHRSRNHNQPQGGNGNQGEPRTQSGERQEGRPHRSRRSRNRRRPAESEEKSK